MFRCPGQDQRFWKPVDIFEVKCPGCDKSIEFFKDEPKLKCNNCGRTVHNPKINLGCVEECQEHLFERAEGFASTLDGQAEGSVVGVSRGGHWHHMRGPGQFIHQQYGAGICQGNRVAGCRCVDIHGLHHCPTAINNITFTDVKFELDGKIFS